MTFRPIHTKSSVIFLFNFKINLRLVTPETPSTGREQYHDVLIVVFGDVSGVVAGWGAVEAFALVGAVWDYCFEH